ncbi:hypothetical protein [Guptibacillus hwajinpoensis]|uniref:hypothetical protein n=1 Tax=Guptibacillus hwajinpoensis TaxID=208199 RepID=UPI0024B3961E|nr:hypothetical protein [Pseudalkalibacillus hwajinpoensis]
MGEYHNEKSILKTKLQKLIYIILCPVVVGIVIYIITLIEGEPFRLKAALPLMLGVSIPQWIIILFFPHFYGSPGKEERQKKNQILRNTIFCLLILTIILLIILLFN